MARLEIYWSFQSPYSYLAIDRLVAISADYDVDVVFRPVRPLALREPGFLERGREQFLPYLMKDFPREAERLGLHVAAPNPNPVDMDLVTGKAAPEQPIMDKIMGLAIAASRVDLGLAFAQCVGRSIWTGVANWHEDAVLERTLADAGLMLQPLARWVAGASVTIPSVIADNEAAQIKHHWGVPLMVLDEEPFFGQDRIAALIWRLNEQGLKRD